MKSGESEDEPSMFAERYCAGVRSFRVHGVADLEEQPQGLQFGADPRESAGDSAEAGVPEKLRLSSDARAEDHDGGDHGVDGAHAFGGTCVETCD